jgi:hypothetical protein
MPERISTLIGQTEWGEVDFSRFLLELAALLVQEIDCARAGVRMLIDTSAGRSLRTMAMHDALLDRAVDVPDVVDEALNDYLATVGRSGGFVAFQADIDPRVPPRLRKWFAETGTRSVMDVAINVNGLIYGTLSCEQRDVRQWAPRQLDLLRRIANRVGTVLVRGVDDELTTPGDLWEPTAPECLAPIRARWGSVG